MMKTKLAKTILYILLGSLLIASLIALSVNIIDYNQESSKIGIVFKVEHHSYANSSGGGGWDYYIKENQEIFKGHYNQREEFSISTGDTISYRKIDFSNGIRALQLNGKKIQNHYGMWDFLSLSFVIIFIVGFFYLPKKLENLKRQHNSKLFKDYNNNNNK